MEPLVSPEGAARRLEPGTDLVIQIHYHPSGKPERDRSRIGLYFYPGKVDRTIGPIVLANRRFEIPAGAKNYRVTASFTVPIDVTLTAITPHMHYLGKTMTVTATFPSGEQRDLIHVPDWDWNWQLQYHLSEPLVLPRGTRLELLATYDNSADNPANPHDPPRAMRWGDQTSDEMCLCFLEVVLKDEADRQRLRRSLLMNAVRNDPLVLRRFLPPSWTVRRSTSGGQADAFESPNDVTPKR